MYLEMAAKHPGASQPFVGSSGTDLASVVWIVEWSIYISRFEQSAMFYSLNSMFLLNGH